MALCDKTLGRLRSAIKSLYKFYPQDGSFSALIKEIHKSFIFSFVERTQQGFNFSEFKEYFIHKKNIIMKFVMNIVFCNKKTLICVSTVTIRGKRYLKFHLKSIFCIFQIFLFDIVFYLPIVQAV